jgi:peptide/nickel transport system substrate-binding protein
MRNQPLLTTAWALTWVLVLAGCSGAGESSSESSGGDIVEGGEATFLLPAAPLDLDPSTSQDNNASMPMWRAWFQTLVEATEKGLGPQLASDWEVSSDSLTYTFTLDSAATFSDGEPVTAADVVFSLKRNLSPEVSLLHFLEAKIASIEAVDTETVRITLKSPWPHLLADLSSPGGDLLRGGLLSLRPEDILQLRAGRHWPVHVGEGSRQHLLQPVAQRVLLAT